MKNILFDLSGKIDSRFVSALYEVKKEANFLEVPFFVVGASARDFILEHCYDVKPLRMTEDLDLGVEVADWDKFSKLYKALLATNKFSPDAREAHRLLFTEEVFIDILPFGPITDKDKKISWPPEHEIFMNMLGFKEAYEHSVTVRLSSNPELCIKLPTLPGLALMKIVSWHERYPDSKKDASDLLFIMTNYERAGIEARLYEEEVSLLEEEDFNAQLAGIRLLGRDMAKMSDPATLKTVKEIVVSETEEQSRYRLVTDMVREFDNFDEILHQVEKLKQGISEV